MENLEKRFQALSNWFEWIDNFTLVIMLFAFAGILYDFIRRKKRDYKEVGANVAIGIGNGLLNLTAYSLIFIVTLYVAEQFVSWKIAVNTWTWILAVLAADFLYYWMHRIEHKVRFLWASTLGTSFFN